MTGAVPLGVDVRVAEAVVGAEIDDAQAVLQQRRQHGHAGAMRQTAENALDAAGQQPIGLERLAAQVEASRQAGVQVGDVRRIVLREVTAAISTCGWRSKILMSSSAV